jgi:hypothetical protein
MLHYQDVEEKKESDKGRSRCIAAQDIVLRDKSAKLNKEIKESF